MRTKVQTVFAALLMMGSAGALACTIENAQEQRLPDGKQISGNCSNSGLPVTCTYREGSGWTCEGSGGSYTNLGNPELPLNSACECESPGGE